MTKKDKMLVRDLRKADSDFFCDRLSISDLDKLCNQAANRIEYLSNELEKLRETTNSDAESKFKLDERYEESKYKCTDRIIVLDVHPSAYLSSQITKALLNKFNTNDFRIEDYWDFVKLNNMEDDEADEYEPEQIQLTLDIKSELCKIHIDEISDAVDDALGRKVRVVKDEYWDSSEMK